MTTLLDAGPAVKSARPNGPISNAFAFPTSQPRANPANVHDAAVAEIVGMIREKYGEEGQRSFAIGKRAFEHAQWQKGNFPAFGSDDFNTLMKRIRDDVRHFVPIKAESIQVAYWTRCHVLRELVRAEIADHAESLTMFEYLAIVGKALSFSSSDLEGDLNPGWLDMIRGVAYDRTAGRKVSRVDFEARVADTIKRVADARSGLTPDALAARSASDASRARKAAFAKANEDITGALSDGLSKGHVTAEGVLAILETVSRTHGIALPSTIGFDPARCTDADCDMLASTMFQAGRHAEMRRLRDRLDKMVAAVDRARETSHGLSARMGLTPA